MTFRSSSYRHYFFSRSDLVKYFDFVSRFDHKYFMTSLDPIVAFPRRLILLQGHKFTHGTVIEIVWTIIPAIILFLIAVPSFILLYAIDAPLNPDMTFKVIGGQWYWDYEYVIVKRKTF